MNLPYALGKPAACGVIRTVPEDFIVVEELRFPLSGQGEHVYLLVEKRNLNTVDIAKKLAAIAGVRIMDIGYAGLKDRHAVSRQWFSIYLPRSVEPEWQRIETDDITILRQTRHQGKLRRGAVSLNSFKLIVRGLNSEPTALESRLAKIREMGVPNYFGEQRFGHQGKNLETAKALFQGKYTIKNRQKRGLIYSSARAMLFNQVLARRVEDGTWLRLIAGDVLQLDGSDRIFSSDGESVKVLQQRLDEQDIHITGPLYGQGNPLTTGAAYALESEILSAFPELTNGLVKAGLKQARRSLRSSVHHLHWQLDKETDILTLDFSLDSGAYATSVLREILVYQDIKAF